MPHELVDRIEKEVLKPDGSERHLAIKVVKMWSVRCNQISAPVADVLVLCLLVALAVLPLGEDYVNLLIHCAEPEHHIDASAILSTSAPSLVQIVLFTNPLERDVWLSSIHHWRFQPTRNRQQIFEVWKELGQPTFESRRIVGEREEAIQARRLRTDDAGVARTAAVPFDLPGLEEFQRILAEAIKNILLLESGVEVMLIPAQRLTGGCREQFRS